MSQLSPSDIAAIDQSVAEAQEELDRLLETLGRCMAGNGDLQGYLDFGAFMIQRAGENPQDSGALLALAVLRLHEARGGAA
jgi:hypothetical protein